MIAGPFVGGIATSTFGIEATFSVVAAISLALAAWALFEPDAQAARAVHVRAAIAAAFSESLILASVVMILAVAVIGGALQVLVPLHLSSEGIERAGIGAVYSVGAMLGAVAILLSGRAGDRFGRIPLAAGACIALAVLSGLLALPLGVALIIAVVIAVGPVQSILYAVGYPLSADGADRAHLGHGIAIGIVNLTWGVGAVLGPIAGPGVAQTLGDRASYLLLAMLAALAAVAIAAPRLARSRYPVARASGFAGRSFRGSTKGSSAVTPAMSPCSDSTSILVPGCETSPTRRFTSPASSGWSRSSRRTTSARRRSSGSAPRASTGSWSASSSSHESPSPGSP